MQISLPFSPRRLLPVAFAAAVCVALVVGLAAEPAAAAKLKYKQPACGKLKSRIAKAKTRAAKRVARRAHAQCVANMQVYRQVRDRHFDGYRTDGVRIDTVYCASGVWMDDGRVGERRGWRVVDAKVAAGGKRFSANVEAWTPRGRHVQGIVRDGNVWKVGWVWNGRINAAGPVTVTNAAATCKGL